MFRLYVVLHSCVVLGTVVTLTTPKCPILAPKHLRLNEVIQSWKIGSMFISKNVHLKSLPCRTGIITNMAEILLRSDMFGLNVFLDRSYPLGDITAA